MDDIKSVPELEGHYEVDDEGYMNSLSIWVNEKGKVKLKSLKKLDISDKLYLLEGMVKTLNQLKLISQKKDVKVKWKRINMKNL